MTMQFRTIKSAIVTLLTNAAAGQYRVRGYAEQNLSAEEVEDTDRLVQVYYTEGAFPKSSSGRGPFDHQMTFSILLTASQAAQADLTVLNNAAATPSELAAALAAAEPASYAADSAIDELIDLVYQVLMAGDNIDLGLSTMIGTRWIDRIRKSEPYPRGDRVVLSATMDLTCRAPETVPSTTKTDLEVVSIDQTFQGDDTVRAGVEEDTT